VQNIKLYVTQRYSHQSYDDRK